MAVIEPMWLVYAYCMLELLRAMKPVGEWARVKGKKAWRKFRRKVLGWP